MTPIPLLIPLLAATAQTPGDGPAVRAEYYLSEARVQSPDGKALGAMVGLGRRIYKPSEGIVEQTDIALESMNYLVEGVKGKVN